MILCARREHETQIMLRVRERFVYSIVKRTRVYDYQTWWKHLRNS